MMASAHSRVVVFSVPPRWPQAQPSDLLEQVSHSPEPRQPSQQVPRWSKSTRWVISSIKPNRFVIQAASSLGNSLGFSVISTASGASVLQGNATLVSGPTGWPGVYYQGNFSALKTPGTYKVQLASGETSFVFLIADATTVYKPSIQAALSYITAMRSTSQQFQAVIDQWAPAGTTVDLRGGWYDASNWPDVYMGYPEDWNYMVVNCESATSYQLIKAYEENPAFFNQIDTNGNGRADILDEAIIGTDWYLKLKPQNLTGGAFYAGATATSTKIYNNQHPGHRYSSIRGGAGAAIAGLAMAARYNLSSSTNTSSTYLMNAEQAWSWYVLHNAGSASDPTTATQNGVENLYDYVWWTLAGIELYRATNTSQYLTTAQSYVDKILASQKSDSTYAGWFDRGDGGAFWHQTDEATVITSLIEYTKIQPNDTTRLARIKTAVKAYMDFKVATTAGSTDTGNNPYATPLIYYRNSSGTWKTRFFEPLDDLTAPDELPSNWDSGYTGRLISLAYAAWVADDFLGVTTYSSFALGQLNWLWGCNPLNVSIQEGLGTVSGPGFKNPPHGSVMNGIRDTNGNDVPTWINSWQSGEYWIPATTPLILALSKAMAIFSSASTAPVGHTIWLKASNGSYVSAWQNDPNSPLEARSPQVQAWEEFQVMDAGEGYIALKANANGNYVSARNGTTNTPLQTVATTISVWERFRWIDLGGGKCRTPGGCEWHVCECLARGPQYAIGVPGCLYPGLGNLSVGHRVTFLWCEGVQSFLLLGRNNQRISSKKGRTTMENPPLRIAVVGCGNIAGGYARTLQPYSQIKLLGATDIDLAWAEQFVAIDG